MRPATLLALLLLLAALLLPSAPPSRAAGDDVARLRDTVLDSSAKDETRLKAARDLVKKDPEAAGQAIVAIGEKKAAVNLPFLASFVVKETTRHLRLVAIHAAWQSAPEGVVAAFLEKTALEDDAEAIRAVDAVGLVAPLVKDRAVYPKLLEIAKGPRTFVGIEAARAVNRSMDPRLQRDLCVAACAATDNHVRKHLVWAVMDLLGDEKKAQKTFESMRARPGDEGKNANECVDVLLDKNATPHAWNPLALKDVPAWWKSGRPKDLKTAIDFKDDGTNSKVQGWFTEMKKAVPLWEHFASSSIPRMAFRKTKDPEIFDMKAKTIELDASEIARCETAWQGSYVLARDGGIALTTQFGEPCTGHRGWEPAYVDLYWFMKATNQSTGAGKFNDWIDEQIAKKGWGQ